MDMKGRVYQLLIALVNEAFVNQTNLGLRSHSNVRGNPTISGFIFLIKMKRLN